MSALATSPSKHATSFQCCNDVADVQTTSRAYQVKAVSGTHKKRVQKPHRLIQSVRTSYIISFRKLKRILYQTEEMKVLILLYTLPTQRCFFRTEGTCISRGRATMNYQATQQRVNDNSFSLRNSVSKNPWFVLYTSYTKMFLRIYNDP